MTRFRFSRVPIDPRTTTRCSPYSFSGSTFWLVGCANPAEQLNTHAHDRVNTMYRPMAPFPSSTAVPERRRPHRFASVLRLNSSALEYVLQRRDMNTNQKKKSAHVEIQ